MAAAVINNVFFTGLAPFMQQFDAGDFRSIRFHQTFRVLFALMCPAKA
jgi:hypothetical protein